MYFLAIIAIIFCLVKDSNRKEKLKKAYERMVDEGVFLPKNPQKSSMINQDIWYDWHGDKELFPKEYINYFEKNTQALIKYIMALQCREEIKLGYQPSYCLGSYNKHTYNPFKNFNTLYQEKIKIFNETGKYYY